VYTSIIIGLSLVMVGLFINANWYGVAASQSEFALYAERVTGFIFTFDYVLRLWASDHRQQHFFDRFTLVDLITVLPFWIDLIFGGEFANKVRPIRVLRALRILRAYRLLAFASSQAQRIFLEIFLIIVSLLICTAGIVQEFESCEDDGSNCGVFDETKGCDSCQDLSFVDSFYFVLVTLTTVGYVLL
jgi:hypothetical protein